jgi:hypothetical protein
MFPFRARKKPAPLPAAKSPTTSPLDEMREKISKAITDAEARTKRMLDRNAPKQERQAS